MDRHSSGVRAARQGSARRCRRLVALLAFVTSLAAYAGGENTCRDSLLDDPGLATAWRALRTMDCGRCHGKDYEGLSAPSIVTYVRTQSRERFDHIVLDGDPPRGMPGYRNSPLVAGTIDVLYRYFLARATGEIGVDERPGVTRGKRDAKRLACGHRGTNRTD